MHVKREYLKSFFIQFEGEIVVQENWKWSTRKMSSRRRRSRTQMIKQKWKRKTEANAKRDEQKQKVMNKGCKKHLMKEKKRMFFMREFFFWTKQKKNGRFFRKIQTRSKKQKVSLFAKKACIEWKRMEKEEKKEDPSWTILRRRMVRCPLQFVVQGAAFFLSTSQQESKKCENWRNHFSRFFSQKFFKKTKWQRGEST